jgi:group I intron endonuclease
MFRNKVNGKVYVGQTIKSFNDRFKGHRQALNKRYAKQLYFYKAVNKYGWDQFEKIILIEGDYTRSQLNDLEKEYISKYQSNNPSIGYNCNSGGQGGNLYFRTEEIKNRISNSLKGHSYNKGIPKTEEHKKKLSQKLLELKGKGLRWSTCKYCIQCDFQGNIIKVFDSAEQAGKELNINPGTIRSIAKKGIKNPACGFKFKITKTI